MSVICQFHRLCIIINNLQISTFFSSRLLPLPLSSRPTWRDLTNNNLMGVYETNIIPIKIARLAEYVSERRRISLDEALTYICSNV